MIKNDEDNASNAKKVEEAKKTLDLAKTTEGTKTADLKKEEAEVEKYSKAYFAA